VVGCQPSYPRIVQAVIDYGNASGRLPVVIARAKFWRLHLGLGLFAAYLSDPEGSYGLSSLAVVLPPSCSPVLSSTSTSQTYVGIVMIKPAKASMISQTQDVSAGFWPRGMYFSAIASTLLSSQVRSAPQLGTNKPSCCSESPPTVFHFCAPQSI